MSSCCCCTNIRLWGKLFEKASAHKAGFDAPALTAFLWAATTANVEHFRTTAELTAAAQKLLGNFTPGICTVQARKLQRFWLVLSVFVLWWLQTAVKAHRLHRNLVLILHIQVNEYTSKVSRL